MGKLFGTDGVRGIYGEELTDDLARLLGYYGTKVLAESGHQKPKIIIGTDTRESKDALTKALCEGISAADGDVLLAGVIPTPAVAVLVRELEADAGIVVSASHNPYEYNGIKFFNGDGFKLPDAVEDKIEAEIFEDADEIVPQEHHVHELTGPEEIYLGALFGGSYPDLSGMKIVVDCANGASVVTAPKFFEKTGADVIFIGDEPNGENINLNCGSTHLNLLAEAVKENEADLGIAFDGDADRCLAVDENGVVIDGDMLINAFADTMRDNSELPDDTVVVTVMSNIGLHKALKEKGMKAEITDVGDRYVLENMLQNGYTLGGEQSGHIINLKKNTTGDGLLSAAMLVKNLSENNRKASDITDSMQVYPQILANAKVRPENKLTYMDDEVIAEEIKKVEDHFDGNGRVLIRPSGTEPLVRVMIEGENQEELDQIAGDLAKLIEERLG